ncbi:MAG: uL15 family ribosomal protein, partial [Chloroflexota bacterium]|nr:uL15 family ribosomal protein [Chloroflexota bacterium]
PYKRGFTNNFRTEYEVVNVGDLERLAVDAPLTPESLVALGLVKGRKGDGEGPRIKLLGNGELTRAVEVTVHKASAGARAKVEAAGGRVEVLA